MKLFVALLVVSAAAFLCAQEGTMAGVYRVNVRVEVVDAQVIHKKTGQPVTSLKREDFQTSTERC